MKIWKLLLIGILFRKIPFNVTSNDLQVFILEKKLNTKLCMYAKKKKLAKELNLREVE